MSYPEYFVQGELAQFRAHGGLCQLGHGIFRVFYTVTSLENENTLKAAFHFPRNTYSTIKHEMVIMNKC